MGRPSLEGLDMETVAKPRVKLTGQDGNAFAIMGAASKAMRRAGVPKEQIDAMLKECTSGDYDHLLQTVMKYCEVY